MRPRHRSAWYHLAVALLEPPLLAIGRREWSGAEHLPQDAGFIVCCNHLSYLDPFTLAFFLHRNGCPPRFLAKESLFRVPLGGRILAGTGQIPVRRESHRAGDALAGAVRAVEAGECVVICPEATLTRDPDLWPMRGKTGAARVALATGCPVVPVAQWGVQEVLPPYGRRLRVVPRRTIRLLAGPAVDLGAFTGRPADPRVLQAATDTILDGVTGLLSRLRDREPPAERWDPRVHGQPAIGHPEQQEEE